MESLATFEIHIKGQRDGHPLTPRDFDVDEWIAALKHGKHLLYSESTSKKRPKITVEQKEGSIRLLLLTATALVVQANALLAKVDQTKELGILPMRQAEAVRFFHKMARDNQFDISFGEAGTVNRALHLHKNLEFQPEERVDEYLDRLIKQATPQLSKIKDKDAWLREIRGYED